MDKGNLNKNCVFVRRASFLLTSVDLFAYRRHYFSITVKINNFNHQFNHQMVIERALLAQLKVKSVDKVLDKNKYGYFVMFINVYESSAC